jgi:hypothetical protein
MNAEFEELIEQLVTEQPCPACGVPAGQPCVGRDRVHRARRAAAVAALPDEESCPCGITLHGGWGCGC